MASTTIGAIIPVRSAASRLPGKPLLDVSGRSALDRVADRARACPLVRAIAIATTTDPSDDALVEQARAAGYLVYRGAVDDVLLRLTEAAKVFEYDLVVEVDGDDLLCSSEYMSIGVEVARETGADLVSFTGLPIGGTPNILRRSALERACAEKTYSNTSTGFFRYLTESGRFAVERPAVSNPRHAHPTARMTLDYPQDLAFFRAVYAELDRRPGWDFATLVELLHTQPALVAINADLDEAYQAHFRAGISQ